MAESMERSEEDSLEALDAKYEQDKAYYLQILKQAKERIAKREEKEKKDKAWELYFRNEAVSLGKPIRDPKPQRKETRRHLLFADIPKPWSGKPDTFAKLLKMMQSEDDDGHDEDEAIAGDKRKRTPEVEQETLRLKRRKTEEESEAA